MQNDQITAELELDRIKLVLALLEQTNPVVPMSHFVETEGMTLGEVCKEAGISADDIAELRAVDVYRQSTPEQIHRKQLMTTERRLCRFLMNSLKQPGPSPWLISLAVLLLKTEHWWR